MKKRLGLGLFYLLSVTAGFFAGMNLRSDFNYSEFLNNLDSEKRVIKVRYVPISVNKENSEKKLNGELELYVTELDLDKDLAVLQDDDGRYYRLTYNKFMMKGKLEEIDEKVK